MNARLDAAPWRPGTAWIGNTLLYNLLDAKSGPWRPGTTQKQLESAESATAWRRLLLSVGVVSKAQLLQLAASAAAAREERLQERRDRG